MSFSQNILLFLTCAMSLGQSVFAQQTTPSLNSFGSPGLIDMPSAQQMEEGTLASTLSFVNGSYRSTLTFQITPRASVSFRYSALRNLPSAERYYAYDRSFDFRYLIAEETDRRPAITIGLQDFAGTGNFSGEYVVASKSIAQNFTLSGGIGWGRLATRGTFSNPLGVISDKFDERPGGTNTGDGGQVRLNHWFRGPAALFAGAAWTPGDGRTTYKVEYSSDAYATDREQFDARTPLNFSIERRLGRNAVVSASLIGGTEFGLRFSTSLNPKYPATDRREEAPLPVRLRGQILTQQRANFGDVTTLDDIQSEHSGAVPVYVVEQSASGVRIAYVSGQCDLAAAKEIDAQSGVIDLVVFKDTAGEITCSVITRPAGQTYVEAVSTRQLLTPAVDDAIIIDNDDIIKRLRKLVKSDGIVIERSSITLYRAEFHIYSSRFSESAQTVGRMARAMTHVLPSTVEVFNIVLLEQGVPITSVEIHRSDLELLEHDLDGAWKSLARAKIENAPLTQIGDTTEISGLYPNLSTSIGPALEFSLFDPDNPLRVDLRAVANARYNIAPGFSLNGRISTRLLGNVNTSRRSSNSVIQRVRTDIDQYSNIGKTTVDRLTADYRFKLSSDVYGRMTAGIFERMYGGLSGEVLWAPDDRNFALGAELNWVKQRDYDQLLSFRDYSTVTGHVSAYWDMGQGFETQLDVGRYLAKDWGATLTVDRVFNNGWRVGGYFTLTDVPFDDFGEGSFDKGIRLIIPLAWMTGSPSKKEYGITIQPILRDGGARVLVPDRLYPSIKPLSPQNTKNSWGRVFR